MDCPRCSGLVVELLEQDEEGEYCECVKCINCGWRLIAQTTGKQIAVVKGLAYE